MNTSDVAEKRMKLFQYARERSLRTKLEGLWEAGPFYLEKCTMDVVNEFSILPAPGDRKQWTRS